MRDSRPPPPPPSPDRRQRKSRVDRAEEFLEFLLSVHRQKSVPPLDRDWIIMTLKRETGAVSSPSRASRRCRWSIIIDTIVVRGYFWSKIVLLFVSCHLHSSSFEFRGRKINNIRGGYLGERVSLDSKKRSIGHDITYVRLGSSCICLARMVNGIFC